MEQNNNVDVLGLVRGDVINLFAQQPNLFDERDLQLVKSDDAFIQQYINEYSAQNHTKLRDQVRDGVISCLKWRKAAAVNDVTIESLPEWVLRTDMHNFVMPEDESKPCYMFMRATRLKRVSGWFQVMRMIV